MELQLGLALPVDDPFTKKLDLVNGEGCGSSLSSDDDDENYGQKRKRDRLVEVAEEADSDSTGLPKTLPLLIWNREPIDDDDDDSQDIHKNGVVGDPLVGWPPIKNFRKQTYGRRNYNVARPNDPVAADVNRGVGDGRDGDGRWRSSYLKVQMEGVLITRKINLSFLHHHQSYNALTHSLISLFGKGRDNIDAYKLTYQDKEGDWMLAGDVPWRVFIGSIQRLKLLKNN